MEKLKIEWSRLALRQTEEIARWYRQKMGQKAMLKFINGIYDTVEILSYSPRIGILDERRSKGERKYYSFLSHPHYRVIYRFTENTLFVVALRATRMKQ